MLASLPNINNRTILPSLNNHLDYKNIIRPSGKDKLLLPNIKSVKNNQRKIVFNQEIKSNKDVKEAKKVLSRSFDRLINKKGERINGRNKRLNRHSSTSNIKIKQNPYKEAVKSLTFDSEISQSYERKYELQKRKNQIDENEEIKLKRLGLFKKAKTTAEKSSSIDKLDTKEREKFLEKEFKEQMQIYGNKKRELDVMEAQIEQLLKENHELSIEIHVLQNYGEFFDRKFHEEEEKIKDMEISLEKEKMYKNSKKDEDGKKKIKFELLNKLEGIRKERKDVRVKKEEQYKFNKAKLKELEEKKKVLFIECKSLKQHWYKLREKLIDYYHLNLYEGLDFKSDGLISLIRSIWNLGVDVNVSFMPTYLDKEAIDYLFNRAKKFIELSKIRVLIEENQNKFLTDLKSWYEQTHKQEVITNNTLDNNATTTNIPTSGNANDQTLYYDREEEKNDVDFFKTRILPSYLDKYPHSKEFMEKYRKNLEMKNELNDIKNYRNVELDKVKIPFKIMEENKNVEKMKFLHNKIKSELIFNEKKEIERLTKEFTFNNYRNNYNVSFEVIISALCGEERKDEEITYLFIIHF